MMRLFTALLVVPILLPASGIAASGQYNGRWSVEAVPEAGSCDGTYVMPVEVSGDRITYIGRAAMRADGGITLDGKVEVSFIQKGDRLDARGTMINPRFGNGIWSSPTENCKGTWVARRR